MRDTLYFNDLKQKLLQQLWPCPAASATRQLARGGFAADAAEQLYVPGHDGHALRVNGAEVGLLKQHCEVGLGSLLQGQQSQGLHANVPKHAIQPSHVLNNLPHETLEREPKTQNKK